MSDSGGEFVFSVTFWLKHQVSVRTVKDNQIANRLIIVICILQYLVEPLLYMPLASSLAWIEHFDFHNQRVVRTKQGYDIGPTRWGERL